MDKLNSKINSTDNQILAPKTNVKENECLTIKHDYALYKAGISFYKRIHPSLFYEKNGFEALFSGFEKKDYEKQLEVFRDILDCFFMAEQYFKRLILNYPTSIWRQDAVDKIILMKKLKDRYSKMDFIND